MAEIVITGANRGIGLELVRLYSARGDNVHALVRRASKELLELPNVRVIEGVDVRDYASVDRATEKFDGIEINLLINNAGVFVEHDPREMNYEAMLEDFKVNAVGPMKVTTAFLSSFAEGGKVAMISSRMGSMGDNSSGGSYGYRMSKAALNAGAVSLAKDLSALGIAVGVFHPGFVQTEMTGGNGDVSALQSAESLQQRFDELEIANAGRFIHAQGEELPW